MQDSARTHVRLPHGVRDYLPEAAARRRAIADALRGEFQRWGYRAIVTPAFEYEAVLRRGLGPGGEAEVGRAALDGIDGALHEQLRIAIGRKDVEEVGRLAADLPAARRRLLEALPSLYGGAEVIERARTFWKKEGPGNGPASVFRAL